MASRPPARDVGQVLEDGFEFDASLLDCIYPRIYGSISIDRFTFSQSRLEKRPELAVTKILI